MPRLLSSLCLLLLATSAATVAATPSPQEDLTGGVLQGLSFTKSKEPVSITADALEFDYRSRVLTYRGKVVAEQGDLKLQSDVLTLTLAKENGDRLESVVAEGHVQLVKGERSASAGRAEFDQKERTVILRLNAVVQAGANQVTGDKITVYLDDERTVVDGGESRVRAVIYPQQSPAPAETR